MQQGRRRRDLVLKSQSYGTNRSRIFPAGTIENSICRDRVDRSLQGNHWEEIAGPLSSSFLTSFVPLLAREQETVPLRRTKARSRFQFSRALATNYSGRRALLHACRCDVPSTPRRASRKRPWNGLTFRASCGESSSRGPVQRASITNGKGRRPLSLILHAPSIAVGPEG